MKSMRIADDSVVLLGAGGHAKVVIDIIKRCHKELNIIGITDKNEDLFGSFVMGVPVLGSDDILKELYAKGVRKAFITLGMIDNYKPREHLHEMVRSNGFELINIIHDTSVVSCYASIGKGNAIMPGSIINAGAVVGDSCIINTGSIIEHDCDLGSNVHIGPGASISGQVSIGDNSMVGVGSCVIQGIKIGRNCLIGAGSVVIRDIPDNSVAVGAPARVIRKR